VSCEVTESTTYLTGCSHGKLEALHSSFSSDDIMSDEISDMNVFQSPTLVLKTGLNLKLMHMTNV